LESDFAHMNRVSMMGELAASLSHEITQPIAGKLYLYSITSSMMESTPGAARKSHN
jgi:C4-dicarboxylate-specific signal transduction histidine kinase